VKRLIGISSILAGSAFILASQPALSNPATVTGVQVTQTSSGIDVLLESTSDGSRPQVFSIVQGNSLVSDIINTQLDLPEGNGFVQNNPAPGISAISVMQLDENSVRVVVSGMSEAPSGQVSQGSSGLILNYATSEAIAANDESAAPTMLAQAPPAPQAPAAPSIVQLQSPDVLVPNPEVYVDGVPYFDTNPGYTPPLRPRAIAPPLGDIAVSNIDTSSEEIELGTSEIVPRLVLRDAPVRDVLSLLARAANMNIVYIGDTSSSADSGSGRRQTGDQAAGDNEIRISLDIENEPVQDVFNYVLRIAALEANREDRTIFVGPRLPDEARDVVARTLRLNQIQVEAAANFLATQGAETRITFQTTEIQTFGEGAAARTVEVAQPPEIVAINVAPGASPLLLQGLSVTTNSDLNSITLVGTPRKVEIAMELLSQLDLRRRQVAVNVKIIDVNLLATEDFNTSFSFGVGNGFFSSDGGAASFIYGDARPPSSSDIAGSRLSPPLTAAPFPDGVDQLEPFLDAQPNAPFGTGTPQPFGVPTLNDGSSQAPLVSPVFDDNGNVIGFTSSPASVPRPPFGTDGNPLQPGVTDINDDTITFGLPQLFQYPTDFLLSLQAQVVSGNAKILTDPTLTIQEGSRATVQLTTEVFGGFDSEDEPIIKDAGLTLDIVVERIDDNGFVTMSVEPTVSSVAQVFETLQGDIVLLQERSVRSERIRMRDGQTLILAGIIQDSDRVDISKVPILGDIPILGALFRRTNRENTRQEVIVLVTPQILDDSDLSDFGYRYSPGSDVQEILQRQGVPLQ
jgi:type IV pilus assembly protein PilQ